MKDPAPAMRGNARNLASDRPSPEEPSVWLRSSRIGLMVMALLAGVGSGFGAVGFRWLIFGFTWLATGHEQFGQQGRVGSSHLPWLGAAFLVLIPAVGGVVYGPVIQRFAREARGHGVPEVMIAVADNGGRIRPQVTVVKAFASALCIGTGGSVGREGPIVQIGSALASGLGQVVRMSESRLRVLVACGAGGAIAATFNAPLTGLFFGFEIILREFSIDALFAVILASVSADLISRAFFGSAPFFTGLPHDLVLHHDYNYLLIVVLGALCSFLGVAFKDVLYKLEDLWDWVWKGRPEWARPAIGGLALGGLLLALPEMYGVGYPVMDKAIAGHIALWLLVVLCFAKMVACGTTIGIGGSGGVFAPSLFVGAMAGSAFGIGAGDVFGSSVGSPAIYGIVAMGSVFGAAAQAPLTSIASVLEMSGNFSLSLPVMLGVGIASGISKAVTYGNIYTTKLLRRGTDIERPRPSNVLQSLTVAEVMRPVPTPATGLLRPRLDERRDSFQDQVVPFGPVVAIRKPQALFGDETLEQALRQLALYGPQGLPVVAPETDRVLGWISNSDVLRALADRVARYPAQAAQANLAADWAADDPAASLSDPPNALNGYEIVEVYVSESSSAKGLAVDRVDWPEGAIVAAVNRDGSGNYQPAGAPLAPGDRVIMLVPGGTEAGASPSTRGPG